MLKTRLLSTCFMLCGQGNHRFQSVCVIAQPDAAAHLFGEIFDDIQPQAGALLIAAVFAAVEFVENKGHILVRNAAAIVADFQSYSTVLLRQGNVNARFGILAGVVDEILNDLQQAVFVSIDISGEGWRNEKNIVC